MKRSEALVGLSREHHHALRVAQELSRVEPAQALSGARRFVEFLARHEVGHFALEEAVLLPLLPNEAPGPALSQRVREDHEYLRDALARLQASPETATADLLHEIGARLRAHVRMEERELFPNLEGSLDAETLEDVGRRLSDDPSGAPAAVTSAFLDAFVSRDEARLLTLSDAAVEPHPLRITSNSVYTGHEGIRRWLADLADRAAAASFEVREVRDLDHERAVAAVQVGIGSESIGVTAVFTVRAGRVVQVHGYFSDEDLLADVGVI
jgi:hemerythrin-like domain-containing protein